MYDIQVNLLHKGDRELQSHDIAKDVRPQVQKIAKNMANVKLSKFHQDGIVNISR
jgi:hypothetical protein